MVIIPLGEENDNSSQYSCLENPIDREPGGLPSIGSQSCKGLITHYSPNLDKNVHNLNIGHKSLELSLLRDNRHWHTLFQFSHILPVIITFVAPPLCVDLMCNSNIKI